MKLSFSLPSKPSSSSKSNLVKPSKDFADKTLDRDDLVGSKVYVNEFDSSKALSESQNNSKRLIIPRLENEWRPLKKMKNLDVPLRQSDDSDLKFESESGVDLHDDSKVTYGLNIRKSDGNSVSANVLNGDDLSRKTAPLEVVMLEKLREDVNRLPGDNAFEDYEDVPVESFAAALMEGYGWQKGQGIGKNAKDDVKVKVYDRRGDKQGLGFVSDVPLAHPKKDEKDRDRDRERSRNGGRVNEHRDRARERDGHDRRADKQGLGVSDVPLARSKKDEKEKVRKHDRSRDGGRVNVNRDQDRERDELAVGMRVRIVGGRDAGSRGEVMEKLGPDWLVLQLSRSEVKVKVRVNDVAELGSREEERFLKKLEELKIQDEKKGHRGRRDVERVGGKSENSTRGAEKGNGSVSWLTSHIRVKIISKDFKGEKFYLKKGEIVDVVGPSICDISIDDSKELIQGVPQEFLETALPKLGGPVLVLYGKHKGAYGRLVGKDRDLETGVVEDADSHALLNVHLEQIAEYIGDPSYLGY